MISETLIINLIGMISKSTLPFTIISGIILFLPDNILTRFKLSDFRNDNIIILGLIFIICIGFHISAFIQKIMKYTGRKISTKYSKYQTVKYISKLTDEEKDVLRTYINEKTQTLYLSIENGVVRGLELKGIILRVANIGDAIDSTFAYNLQPYIYKYLLSHKAILE